MGAEEGILYADCDLEIGIQMKLRHDFAGHYNRPDIFHLQINRSAPQLYSVHGDQTRRSARRRPRSSVDRHEAAACRPRQRMRTMATATLEKTADPRITSAIGHWGPRFVTNGVALTDFEEVTRAITLVGRLVPRLVGARRRARGRWAARRSPKRSF